MEDDYFFVEDESKYFNLQTRVNFLVIIGLLLLKTMGGFTVEIGRT